MLWIISFAPLISYRIIGILHKWIVALMPLADSQIPLYVTIVNTISIELQCYKC